MEKLLVVDDSKTILSLVEGLIEEQELFTAYYAETLEQVKMLVNEHQFFGALCDLVLPDAQKGEVVDFCLSHGIPTIAMTASVDSKLRNKIIEKPIIDYVIKNSAQDIKRAVSMFQILVSMKGSKALIVDDSELSRKSVKGFLNRLLFKVTEATNGDEAMKILKDDQTFKLIVTDHNMPGMSGIRLVQKINSSYPDAKMVIFGITGSNDASVRYCFLKNGANDYFTMPLIKEEVNAKVFYHMRQIQILEDSETLLEKAEHNERNFRLMVEGVGDEYLIYRMSLDGTLLYVSSAIKSFAGVTVEEALGKRWNEVFNVPQEYTIKVRQKHEALISGEDTETYEASYINHNGLTRVIEATDRLEVDKKGNPIAIIGILKDLTERKKMELELQQLSLTDPMTHLFNRRYYNEHFPKLIGMGSRERKPVAMILLDVDHFKQYNDNYGHQKGDEALIAIANAIKECCTRGTDTPFRLGGEEFGVLIYGVNNEEAKQFADKIRTSIEKLEIEHAYNSASEVVTASFGVAATIPGQRADMDRIYKFADEALYMAKENGRNRIEVKL